MKNACLVLSVVLLLHYVSSAAGHLEGARGQKTLVVGVRRGGWRGKSTPPSTGEGATTDKKMGMGQEETLPFAADVQELMGLIINSFYSKKEIFLRELLSNAADALHKARQHALASIENMEEGSDHSLPLLEILLVANPEQRTLIIADSGIGMSREELGAQLGTLAASGTRGLLRAARAAGQPDPSLIGKFGVGFYSTFLVADQVEVFSRAAAAAGGAPGEEEEEVHVWRCTAPGDAPGGGAQQPGGRGGEEGGGGGRGGGCAYTLGRASGEELRALGAAAPPAAGGTAVVLRLRPGLEQFADAPRLRRLVAKHSRFSPFPIKLKTIGGEEGGWEALAAPRPPWRPPQAGDGEGGEGEELALYRSLFPDCEDYFAADYLAVDGRVNFQAVLYLNRPGFRDDIPRQVGEGEKNFKLYVRQVLLTDTRVALCPNYLCFARGVVNCDDLPLNVSREMLQKTRFLRLIQRQLARKVLAMVGDLHRRDPAGGRRFLDAHGKHLKLGLQEDPENQERIVALLRYPSLHSGQEYIGFQEYLEQMPEDQGHIFYLIGDSLQTLEASPLLESLRSKGYNVLFMTEPVDEYAMQHISFYKGVPVISAAREDLGTAGADEELEGRFKHLCSAMRAALGGRVARVAVSARLVASPCAVVAQARGPSANMERILRAQTMLSDSDRQRMLHIPKVLEINPHHPVIRDLRRRAQADDGTDTKFREAVDLLFEAALLAGGYAPSDPARLAAALTARAARALRSSSSSSSSSDDDDDGGGDGDAGGGGVL